MNMSLMTFWQQKKDTNSDTKPIVVKFHITGEKCKWAGLGCENSVKER